MIDHLSYSSIQTYMTCPRSWYYKYVEKRPVVTNEAMFFGKLFHSAIESYLVSNRTQAPVTFMGAAWEANKEEAFALDGATPEQVVNEGVRLLSDRAIIDTLNTITPLIVANTPMIETKIEWKIVGVPVPVIGYVDCITDDRVVCDFKTTARSWATDKAALEIQPAVYLAALAQMGLALDGWNFRHYVFVRTKAPKCDVFQTQRSCEQLDWAEDMIREVWQGIEDANFPPNPFGWKCSPSACEFWAACRG